MHSCLWFQAFHDEINVMRTLAKPRRISLTGSNGRIYMFLGKPKDDLRKDARLMDFNSIINKLLNANSESRRRQLRVFHPELSRYVLVIIHLCFRYSHVQCSDSQRGVRLYSMGTEHGTHTPHTSRLLRDERRRTMG
jgi:hypothetical protein